jgi:hypothetical protein
MAWWLKAVPLILANAPALVDGARKLLDKRRTAGETLPVDAGDEGAIARRLAQLENRERKMLELIESLASSNQQLAGAVSALRLRARINLGISIALAIGLLVALLRSFA